MNTMHTAQEQELGKKGSLRIITCMKTEVVTVGQRSWCGKRGQHLNVEIEDMGYMSTPAARLYQS